MKLAGKYIVVRNVQHTFKKTVLAKNNPQNLKLIRTKKDEKFLQKREEMISYQ